MPDSALVPRTLPPGVVGIVYFDGYCGLCDRFVGWLLRHDREHRFRYTPLQGTTAAARLPHAIQQTLANSVIVEDAAGFHNESTAILRVLAALNGGWFVVAQLLRIVPRNLRDVVYRWIARHRYQWFGQRATCRLPTPTEREVFLP